MIKICYEKWIKFIDFEYKLSSDSVRFEKICQTIHFFSSYTSSKNILVECEVTSFDGMLILATSLPFRFSSRNISFALAHTLRRGLWFLACQCALFNYCCSRACKFKATLTIPRPVATSVQIYICATSRWIRIRDMKLFFFKKLTRFLTRLTSCRLSRYLFDFNESMVNWRPFDRK